MSWYCNCGHDGFAHHLEAPHRCYVHGCPCASWVDPMDAIRADLAASQERERVLREALEACVLRWDLKREITAKERWNARAALAKVKP